MQCSEIPDPWAFYVGFVGQNVTLPCEGFQWGSNRTVTRIDWYFQCLTCGVDWSPIAHVEIIKLIEPRSDYTTDFSGATASVSLPSGSLTILKYQASVAGFYMCQSTGTEPHMVEMRSAGEDTTSQYSSYTTRIKPLSVSIQ